MPEGKGCIHHPWHSMGRADCTASVRRSSMAQQMARLPGHPPLLQYLVMSVLEVVKNGLRLLSMHPPLWKTLLEIHNLLFNIRLNRDENISPVYEHFSGRSYFFVWLNWVISADNSAERGKSRTRAELHRNHNMLSPRSKPQKEEFLHFPSAPVQDWNLCPCCAAPCITYKH